MLGAKENPKCSLTILPVRKCNAETDFAGDLRNAHQNSEMLFDKEQ